MTITARLGAVDGARVMETLAGFADAQHATDQRAAVAAGNVDDEGFPVGERSAAQCRADGFMAICDTAATAAPGTRSRSHRCRS